MNLKNGLLTHKDKVVFGVASGRNQEMTQQSFYGL